MIGSGIVWRMALGNLRKHWRQTLLTIAAGAIGAMLIAISAVNYESVQRSGTDWIETRLGPINWKLTPNMQESGGFTQDDVELLSDMILQTGDLYRILPYVTTEAAIMTEKAGEDKEEAALTSMLLLGFPLEAAARLDPARATLWEGGLGDDELILNDETAGLMSVQVGDVVTIVTKEGSRLFRIRDVVEQSGLTGYRESGSFRGTIIATERTVRELAGMESGQYPALLAGYVDPDVNLRAMFRTPELSYDIQFLKQDYTDKVGKMNFTVILGLISMVAIASSLLFMRQALVMIGESRGEIYGILRAIGLSTRNISTIFAIEALLLSLLSALAGTALGLTGGYGLVRFVYSAYAEELMRMSGENIPIHPHVSLSGAAVVFGIVMLFLTAVSLMAARKAGKVRIVEALRGAAVNGTSGKKSGRVAVILGTILGLWAVVVHLYGAFIDPPGLEGNNVLLIGVSWIGSCCAILFFAIYLARKADKPLQWLLRITGIPQVSIMLAVRYPRRHMGRTYTAALLFALVMMMITFTITLLGLISAFGDVERTNQTVFGYGGYASYQSEDERTKIEAVAAEDPAIREHVKSALPIEPFMINFIEQSSAQAVIPVTEELVMHGDLRLLERSPEFQSDEEAWRAVSSDPLYIILPHYYMEKGGNMDADFMPVKAGDVLTLPVYEDKLRPVNDQWEPVAEHTFTVAGFTFDETKNILIDLYAATFVHPSVMEKLRPYGFKWENQPGLGFVLFDFDAKDIKLSQSLEERFAIQSVLTFKVPYLDNRAEQLMNKQFGKGFVGFTVFSALIGIMGLAVIQYRAVQERSKQVAMMRCIGMPGKQMYWMFLIEGFVISFIGLLTGWAIGSSGARLIVQLASKSLNSHEAPLGVSYPYEVILPILVGLLAASLLLNIAPAKAALRLKAADVLRMNQE